MIDATWIVALGIGAVFGWAWGRTNAPANVEPSGDWKSGYVAGFDDARTECIKIARAHDYATIDRQLTRLNPKP